jgi:hypothetical protein
LLSCAGLLLVLHGLQPRTRQPQAPDSPCATRS